MTKIPFAADEVAEIIKLVIKEYFESEEKIGTEILSEKWLTKIEEKVLWNLSKLQKPFKYIATCEIMQNNGSGLAKATSCFWDSTTDGIVTVQWKNALFYCIVTVFGLAI